MIWKIFKVFTIKVTSEGNFLKLFTGGKLKGGSMQIQVT